MISANSKATLSKVCLANMQHKSSNGYTFTYNDESIRVSKTVGNITTTYIYNGTRLVAEHTSSSVIIYN